MAKQNNFPTGKLDELPAEFAHETVGSLRELYEKGKPETDEEVEKRINDFLSFVKIHLFAPVLKACLWRYLYQEQLYGTGKRG